MDDKWAVLRCSGGDTVQLGGELWDLGGYAPFLVVRRKSRAKGRRGQWEVIHVPILPTFIFLPAANADAALERFPRDLGRMHIDGVPVLIPVQQIAEMEATIEARRKRWNDNIRNIKAFAKYANKAQITRDEHGPEAPGVQPVAAPLPETFAVGDRVIIIAGPFKGFEATIRSVGESSLRAEFGGIFGTIEVSPFLLRRHHAI